MSLSEAEFADADFGIRVLANIPGRYSLADLRNSRGERRVFACRAVNLSCRAIALAAPVKGKVGDRVIAHIDRLGKLEGPIDRLLERGFVMSIAASQEERSTLAAKIAWLESLKNHEVPDRRGDKRVIHRRAGLAGHGGHEQQSQPAAVPPRPPAPAAAVGRDAGDEMAADRADPPPHG